MNRTYYTVAVAMNFDDVDDIDSPEEAVRRMIEWLSAHADEAGYRVERHYVGEYIGDDLRAPDSWFIDAETIAGPS